MSFKLTPQQRAEADELWQAMVDGKVQELSLIYEVIYLRAQIALIARTFWSDVPEDEWPADLVEDLIERHDYWLKQAGSLEAFKRSVDEALNSGDGSYRP